MSRMKRICLMNKIAVIALALLKDGGMMQRASAINTNGAAMHWCSSHSR
jgi:hypothetical protein